MAIGLVLSALALAETASAISRKQADRIAMKVLKTESKKDVILFRDTRRLRPRDTVAFATRARVPVSKKGFPRVGRRAWLYWQDLAPYASFEHRSEMLVLDDRTGRVLRRKKLLYYPIVNGRPPPYLRSPRAYRRAKYRVFEQRSFDLSDVLSELDAAVTSLEGPAAPIWEVAPPSRQTSSTARVSGLTIPPSFPRDAFQHDCVLMLGQLDDWQFKRDFPAFAAFAGKIGLRTFYATREGLKPSATRPRLPNPRTGKRGDVSEGTVASLKQDVKHLVDKRGCRDILIFAVGHGASKASSKRASVQLTGSVSTTPSRGKVENKAQLTATTLKAVVAAFPATTFKLKIGACFSGRFRAELADNGKLPRNVLVLETSSSADQESYSVLDVPWRKAAEQGLEQIAASKPELAAQLENAAFREQVLDILEKKLRETRKAVEPNTGQLFEFTHANIVGMSRYIEGWAEGQPLVGGSRLAAMVDAAVDLGKDSNQAVLLGKETPSSLVNPDGGPAGEAPPPPPARDCEVGAVADPAERTRVEVRIACTKSKGGIRLDTTAAGVTIAQASLPTATCLSISSSRWTCFLEDAMVATIDLTTDAPLAPGARVTVDVFSAERPIDEYEVVVA